MYQADYTQQRNNIKAEAQKCLQNNFTDGTQKIFAILRDRILCDTSSKARYWDIPYTQLNQLTPEEYRIVYDRVPLPDHRKVPAVHQLLEQLPFSIYILITDTPGSSYSLLTDVIEVPHYALYHSINGFYCSILHETVHATGYKDRLNRHKYLRQPFFLALEELIAEIGALFLAVHTGIANDSILNNIIAYITIWGDRLLAVCKYHSVFNQCFREVYKWAIEATQYILNTREV